MTRHRGPLRFASVLLLALSLLFSACATIPDAHGAGQKLDPWENWNRKVFAFNEGLDENFLKPVATVYAKVVPQFVRRGVDNFFGNAADAWSAINNLLQGKLRYAMEDTVRFTTNSVFGFAGLLDIATEFGLDHRYEDFGQTLGTWGFGAGAYVVWPLFGPSSVRDSIALPLDRSVSPALVIDNGGAQWSITALQVINTRANLLGASQLLDDIALDKYAFLRDAYLQRRRSLVFDGDEPASPNPADDADVPMPAAAASAPTPAASAAAAAPAASAASAPK